MRADAALPLDKWQVFASRDPAVIETYMRLKDYELDLAPREKGAFDFLANVAYLPSCQLGYIRYGAAVRVRVPERKRDDYFVHLPLRGSCEVSNRAGGGVCGGLSGVVSSPAGHLTHSEEGSDRITMSLPRPAMIGQLAALLGDEPTRPLELSPGIDLAAAGGQRFCRLVRHLIADLGDLARVRNPILLGTYEQLILTELLLCQHNSYTEALGRLEGNAAPGAVKRAIDYMHGHLDRPVTLADIVAAAGIPGRTLFKHFHDHRGTSPMRYLRDARLGRIRKELLQAQGDVSVTEIAMKFGVHHLGRFSAEYRGRFGETPSETWKRRAGGRQSVFPRDPSDVGSSL